MKILIRNQKHEKWQMVQSAPYGAEDELQRLLAEEPSLISINEVREAAGVLVAAVREFPLEIGAIDLVGFTANGDIAVIECKLANNPEIKRKVIGQVLEYGANLWGMDYETLDEKVSLRSGKSLADLVHDAAGDPDWDEERFRANIKASLEKGNFILIIVVDAINEELGRTIRFVNDAGRPSFSFAALEMQRYQHGQAEMLIPHVFGTAPQPKRGSDFTERKKWDETSFFAELNITHPDCVDPAQKIYHWATKHKKLTRITWGTGGKMGSFVPVVEVNGKLHQLFAVYTYGTIEIFFQYYLYKPPFDSISKRKELLSRLNKIGGVKIPEDGINRRPNIQLAVFKNPDALQELLQTFDWVIEEILSS
jgi:hypothetical protein